jgi:hypothetical protein
LVRQQKEAVLISKIKNLLPDFVRACRANDDVMIIHQGSFAAHYQDDEYALLGMAIKFAGLDGREVRVIGTNRETLKELRKPEFATVGALPAWLQGCTGAVVSWFYHADGESDNPIASVKGYIHVERQ